MNYFCGPTRRLTYLIQFNLACATPSPPTFPMRIIYVPLPHRPSPLHPLSLHWLPHLPKFLNIRSIRSLCFCCMRQFDKWYQFLMNCSWIYTVCILWKASKFVLLLGFCIVCLCLGWCCCLLCCVLLCIPVHQLSSFCQFDTFNGCALEIQMLFAAWQLSIWIFNGACGKLLEKAPRAHDNNSIWLNLSIC